MNRKIFVMSWFYPPINSSESFVTFKLLSHSDYRYDVWTRESVDSQIWDRGVDDEPMEAKNIKVIRGSYKNIKEWVETAYKYFVEHVDEYDCIMTRSMPPESHKFGRMIKKKFPNIKWIASYGDPLVDTPYLKVDQNSNPYLLKRYIEKENPSKLKLLKLAISPMRNANKIIWKKEKKAVGADTNYVKINDFTIKMSDMIIVNNNYQKEYIFSGKYRKYINKCLVIPHSFDEKMYPKASSNNKKIIFTYTGHLDTIRNAGALLKALNKMRKSDSDLNKKVEFDFYGHLSDKDKIYIIDNNLCELVKIKNGVSYKKSLEIMKKSNVLLLIDANFNGEMEKNVYFPAKLADYIGAGTPIMAITQLDGASADIVRKVGGGIVCTHSVDEIMMYLAKIIYKKYKPKNVNVAERNSFRAKDVAGKMDMRIKEILE